jgi:Flp pilus assembly protein TadD
MTTQGLGSPVGRLGLWAGLLFGICLAVDGCTPTPAADPSASPSEGVLNVADAAIAGNDPQMALKMSQTILASDPKNLQALYHEGAAYYAVGRCEDSIAAYKVALGIDPTSSIAEVGIGRCLIKRNAAEAELAFAAATQDDSANAVAWDDLGIARDLQGKYQAAREPYEKSLLLAPGQLATEVNLGMSLALSGDAADALQYLGPLATGSEATPKIRQDYAAALVAAGRDADARQVLAVDLSPDEVDRLMALFKTEIFAPPPVVAPAAVPAAPTETAAPVVPVATVTPAVEPAPPVATVQSSAPAPVPPPVAPTPASPVVEGNVPPPVVRVAPATQQPDAAAGDTIQR